jgi:hypothetical protein
METPQQPPPDSTPQEPAVPPGAKKANAEQMAQRLRAAVRQSRPRFVAWLILALALLAIPLGLWLWWVWPRSQPPRLAVIAFDQLVEPVSGRTEAIAQLVSADTGVEPARLDGFEVFFHERTAAQLPNAAARSSRGVSDADGRATAPLETSIPDGVVSVIVRHAIPRPRHSTEDSARAFFKPKGARICVVDLDALTAEANPKWSSVPVAQIKVRDGAATALKQITKKGFQVVYAALELERPEAYRAARGWVQYQASNVKPPLPIGPVLCRFLYGARVSADEARALLLKDLAARNPDRESRKFVTVTTTAAAEYARVGPTYLLGGDGPSPPGITRTAAWADLK